MALAWIDNELFLDYRDIKIYRLYKGDMQSNPLIYHFGFSPDATEVSDDTFDVRNLPLFAKICELEEDDEHLRKVMRYAIDLEVLKKSEEGGAPCSHHWSLLEVGEDEKGLHVLCARCTAITRDLVNWTVVKDGRELQTA